MGKKICRDYQGVTVEIAKVRGGYRFFAEDKKVKVKDIEEFDQVAVAKELGLKSEEAEKFVNKLAWLYRVSPEKHVEPPEVRFSSYNGRLGVAVGLADLFLFVEKKKNWSLQLLDTQIQESLTPWIHVQTLNKLRREPVLREALQLRFRKDIISLTIARIIEVNFYYVNPDFLRNIKDYVKKAKESSKWKSLFNPVEIFDGRRLFDRAI